MPLPIILDKSSFQSLGHHELIQLQRYYMINVTPLLVSEILGDLSKDELSNKKLLKDIVIELANKIFPANTYINTNYKKLLEYSLIDEKFLHNNKPFLDASESINTGTKQGYISNETEEEKSINRWKNGNFTSIDEIKSWFWRAESKGENILNIFKSKMKVFSKIRITDKTGDNSKNLLALKSLLFVELNKIEKQKFYLILVIYYFEVDYRVAGRIFNRWESGNFKSLNEFSSYAYFCLTIISMFYVGINNKFFSERKTNLIDLEYLFYTPCCRVFSSNDKFLISLFNLVNPKNVNFISSNSLKSDLSKFHQYQIDSGEIKEVPPVEDTETFRLWDKVYDLKLTAFLRAHPKSKEQLKNEYEEIIKVIENGKQGDFDGEPNFITKSFSMRPTDPCLCGSGKNFNTCCLPLGI